MRPLISTFYLNEKLSRTYFNQLTSPSSLRIRLLNSLPSRHKKSSPEWIMPHLIAIARAVLMLSPVTIRTVMPARWHFLIASGTCGDYTTQGLGVNKHMLTYSNEHVSTPECGWNRIKGHVRNYLWPNRVLNAHHTNAGESSQDICLIIPIGLPVWNREVPVGNADGPQALRSHGFNHLFDHVIPISRPEVSGIAIAWQDFTAP